jgi:putative two-component system response regulator
MIGAQLLAGSNSPIMKMAQTIALTHHEKWDGTGYPKKLRGNEIPLVGQLCSICDVFDALTSLRPYKKAWTIEDATQEIIRQRGKQFSPDLVDKFIIFLPKFKEIKEEYID